MINLITINFIFYNNFIIINFVSCISSHFRAWFYIYCKYFLSSLLFMGHVPEIKID